MCQGRMFELLTNHFFLNLFIFLQKRNELIKDKGKEMVTSPIKEGNNTIKSKRALSQIIDTTLLKCYLQVAICINHYILHFVFVSKQYLMPF